MLSQEQGFTPSPPRARRVLRGNYYLAFVIGWENYYHWNHDVIMRLWKARDELPQDIRFLVPPRLKPFQQETLRLLRIPPDRQVAYDGDEVWEIEHLYFSTPILKTQIDIPGPLEWFRDLCRMGYQIRPSAPTRRIFLTRKTDDHYQLVNETEVERELALAGFETCAPGQMTLQEQVTYFSQAQMIVGTGTGLSNMVFAPPGAVIVQFQEPAHIVHALWTMSEALGHPYWCLMGESVPNPRHRLANIHVPLELLSRTLMAVESAHGESPARPR